MYIYQRLKDLREDNECKQSEIAELLQISQQQYSMYEKGKREIPLTPDNYTCEILQSKLRLHHRFDE